MEIINNTTHKPGDDLKASLKSGDRLKIAASCFSIFAFDALKRELAKLEKLEFIFTAPTFVPEAATDEFKRERREFANILRTLPERRVCNGDWSRPRRRRKGGLDQRGP